MDTHRVEMQLAAELVQALRDPACYPHPVDRVEVIETHISWVLLAGDFAYKLKKPVRLPFLDFSTLALRRHHCEEELRLNARAAPDLYLAVVGIGGGAQRPHVGMAGEPAIEYAVKMRRFPSNALFSVMAREGRLEPAHVDALAEALGRLHAGAARVPAQPGQPRRARQGDAALANFAEMTALGPDPNVLARLVPLRRWTHAEMRRLAGRFAERAAGGFERECHGDLHLANVALVDGRPLPFDGIEFSDALRWIDVASDVAFVAMDLARHGLPRLAARFIDRYLAFTGDYGALAVLRFYLVYRAMVRAKVAAIGLAQAAPRSPRALELRSEMLDFLGVAERLSRRGPALLILMHGLSGSGKTTAAGLLLEALGAVRVRSDVERKRLAGLEALAHAGAPPGLGLYGAAASRATYERLEEVARIAIDSGWPVIVDAASLLRADRERFRRLARELGASFRIVACAAPQAVLRARIAERARRGRDASDADLAVLDWQVRGCEPLAPEERALVVDTALPDHEETLEGSAARLLAA